MAEQKLFQCDPNMLSMPDLAMETDASLANLSENIFGNPSESIPQDSVAIDQLLARTSTNTERRTSSDGNNSKEGENYLNSEEQNVESPTTGEGFTFKCVYCDRVLSASDKPKLLECLHNCCSSCLNSKLYDQSETTARGQIECPLCNVSWDSSKVIDNQFLLELAHSEENASTKAQDLKCSSCSDEAPATSFCTDCSEFICDNCVQAHQRLKITKDHIIKTKEEGLTEQNLQSNGHNSNLFCKNHPHEKLSLFCETCDKLTCRDCQLIEHRDHKYKFTTEIASEAKKTIEDMLKDVGYKRALLKSAMKVIDDRQNLITEKKQSLVKEITQLVVKLTNTINVRGKQLVSKLTEVCDSKQKTLHEKKLALEQLSKMTDHCIQFTLHALETGSDMALLYSKKTVTDHLKRIKCKRADIPNPEIPVRIHLALDKVPDLIKVMSTIGQIVVDGRVYPSQPPSPSAPHQQSPSPHGAPSGRPPQQPSPMGSPLQQPTPSGVAQAYQLARLPAPPPYGYGHGQYAPNVSVGRGMGPPMGGGGGVMPPVVPISLAQQLGRMGRSQQQQQQQQLQRALMPSQGRCGLNQQQQQVSSSTHPQGMLQDRSNLRHLLQPNGGPVYIQTGPSQYQAVQPHLAPQFQVQRFQNQLRINAMNAQNQQHVRMAAAAQAGAQQLAAQQQQQAQAQQRHQQLQSIQPRPASAGQGYQGGNGGAKWHIPQQSNNAAAVAAATVVQPQPSNSNRSMTLPAINDNFKITLRQQPEPNGKQSSSANGGTPTAAVTSTIPKTPSPNHVQGRSDTERNLDKFCEESVKDLMATIAKLDSNGVQVLAEGRQKGGSPHVDSSTGDAAPKIKSEAVDSGKDDPNEDWCAVCMDGGELVCCDKCPKVFHQYCHIPNLNVEENETWQCLLCMNFADIPESVLSERKDGELSVKERKIAERIVLELYCQYDVSLPFREVIGPENAEYHSIIKNPIALDTIRQKLNWSADNHYKHMEELVRDVRLMFKNAYTFNPVDSQVYNDAKTLEKFFDEQLEKFLPEYAYENFEDDEIQPPSKKFKKVVSD